MFLAGFSITLTYKTRELGYGCLLFLSVFSRYRQEEYNLQKNNSAFSLIFSTLMQR